MKENHEALSLILIELLIRYYQSPCVPSQPTEKHHRERPEQSSPLNESVVSAASALNRLAASNGEITITTTHGPSGAGVKPSPSSMHNAKKEEEDLNDSPSKIKVLISFSFLNAICSVFEIS